jgi:hypothetical protein
MFTLRRSGCSRWTDLGVHHGPKPAPSPAFVPLHGVDLILCHEALRTVGPGNVMTPGDVPHVDRHANR